MAHITGVQIRCGLHSLVWDSNVLNSGVCKAPNMKVCIFMKTI